VPHCQIFFNQLQGKTLKILKEKKEHYKCVDGTVLNYCDPIFYVKQVGMVSGTPKKTGRANPI